VFSWDCDMKVGLVRECEFYEFLCVHAGISGDYDGTSAQWVVNN